MGYGTIGSGVVEVLDINKNSIAKRAGEEIGVKYILDLRDFPGDPIQEKVVHDYKMIANDPEVQIVVETMGGAPRRAVSGAGAGAGPRQRGYFAAQRGGLWF